MSGSIDWFAPTMSAEQVKSRSVIGVAASMLRRVGIYGIRLLSLMFLARMLTPSDMGLIAMVVVFTGMATLLVDMQMSVVTIRHHEMNHRQGSNLFWLRLANALVMTILVVAAAPLVESFYGDERVATSVMGLSAGIILVALGAQHTALLKRNLRIPELARVEVMAALITALVSIWGARQGLAHWALIIGALAGHFVNLLLVWTLCDWRPARPLRHAGMKPMLVDGARYTSYSLLAFASGNLSHVLIGRGWGAAAAGQYSRAFNVQSMMLNCLWEPLAMVAGPAMAKLHNTPERLRSYYYKVTVLAVMGSMPFAFVGLALPEEFIRVLLGEQWDRAGNIFRLLALGILPGVLCSSAGWVFFSIGNSVAVMQWGFIGWGGMIVGVLVGALFGVEGIALATSVTSALLTWPCLKMAFRETPLQIGELFRILALPLGTGLACGVACWLMLVWLPLTQPLGRLILGAGAFAILYSVMILAVASQRRLIFDIVRELGRKRAPEHG